MPPPADAASPAVPFGWMDLALLGVAAIWGANFVVVKAAVAEFQPLVFAAVRFSLATLVMLPLLAGRRPPAGAPVPRLTRRAWLQLGLLALLGNVLFQPAATLGVDRTTATNAALIVASAPAWVAVLGAVFGLERLGARAWLGVGLSTVGLVFVVAGTGEGLSLAGANMLGNALSLAAALGWAASTLLTRPLVAHHSAHRVVVLSNLLAIPALLLLAVPEFRAQDWGAVTATAWLQLGLSALLAVCLAYVIWARGVQRLGAARTAVYGNLMPVFAAVAGFAFLGERLALPQVIGAVLVVVGIGLARQK